MIYKFFFLKISLIILVVSCNNNLTSKETIPSKSSELSYSDINKIGIDIVYDNPAYLVKDIIVEKNDISLWIDYDKNNLIDTYQINLNNLKTPQNNPFYELKYFACLSFDKILKDSTKKIELYNFLVEKLKDKEIYLSGNIEDFKVVDLKKFNAHLIFMKNKNDINKVEFINEILLKQKLADVNNNSESWWKDFFLKIEKK